MNIIRFIVCHEISQRASSLISSFSVNYCERISFKILFIFAHEPSKIKSFGSHHAMQPTGGPIDVENFRLKITCSRKISSDFLNLREKSRVIPLSHTVDVNPIADAMKLPRKKPGSVWFRI